MFFVLLTIVVIIFLFTKVEFKNNEKFFVILFFVLFSSISLYVFSIIEMNKMPVIYNKSMMYKVENGITKDKEFAFFYTETKCVIFKRNGEYYRKVYHQWSGTTFNLDKDLYLVYNRMEREKISNWFFFLPLQSIEEFYGLTQ
jgi:hypothetical protein